MATSKNMAGKKRQSSQQVQALENWFAKVQFNYEMRTKFYSKMASLLNNGVPMISAMQIIHKRASNDGKNRGAPLAVVLEALIHQLNSGSNLSNALRPWIPTAEAMLISAGERGGSLEASMKSAIEVMGSGKRMSSAVIGGVTYPAILIAASMGIMYMFGTKIIPEFARVTDPQSWTGAAAGMYVMSEVVRSWTLPIVGLIGVLVTALVVSLPRYTGGFRVTLDRLPPWSIYRLSVGSGFMMSLAALVKAGVPLEKALMELRNNTTPYLKQRITGAIMGLRSGVNLGEAFNRAGHRFPDQEMIDDISIYASLSGFDKAMETVSAEWLEKGVEDVKAKAKLLNGLATAMMAGVIGFLVYGMISIQQTIGQAVQGVN